MKTFIKLYIIIQSIILQGCSTQHGKYNGKNWIMGGFERPSGVNPVIAPDSSTRFYDPLSQTTIRWEDNDTFNPAAAVIRDSVYVIYRAEDKTGIKIGHRTSRLGLAASGDGLHFERSKTPIFFPDKDSQQASEWPGGTEDPRIAQAQDGTFVMFYTQWNRKVPRLGVATSSDLRNWTKHGPIFKKSAKLPNLVDMAHKSASILTKLVGDRLIITQVNGKYWLYWGEHGVYGATSDNLIDWEPVVDKNGKLQAFITPREGYFDSSLTECGPPAILTAKGILLLYNGKNHADKGDPRFNKNTYSAGQVLFDRKDPTKVLARLDTPFLRPMEAFEKSGQYVDGTVFIEGLVYFKQKWFLYYGCADSRVGVAVFDPQKPAAIDPLPE
ncbi:glycoside hydrolase family 130 protein [Sphingobacterium sp. HMA12]|uniref:glycoside hydrolase family 130 protein n=1 Tax=Sphingobacterium sp. HMA12 TaxID=2050894 RepID=UPI000CE9C684|nr:glycoside hydrolase family 130 protein [Sphingobacterium sp. HMA12]